MKYLAEQVVASVADLHDVAPVPHALHALASTKNPELHVVSHLPAEVQVLQLAEHASQALLSPLAMNPSLHVSHLPAAEQALQLAAHASQALLSPLATNPALHVSALPA